MQKKTTNKKLGSFPLTNTIITNYITLLIFAIFAILWLHTDKISLTLKESIKIQIYLERNATEKQIKNINKWLTTQDFVLNKNKQKKITFISREKAAKQFIKDTGEDFKKILKENPLRSSYIININPKYLNQINNIKKNIEQQDSVFETSYTQTIVHSITKNLKKIRNILLVISTIMSLIILTIINNTMKLAMHSQRLLIKSMQLVGATNNFIRLPFIKRTIIISTIASLLATLTITTLMNYINNTFNINIVNKNQTYIISTYITIINTTINLISTYKITTKYLNTELDKMY